MMGHKAASHSCTAHVNEDLEVGLVQPMFPMGVSDVHSASLLAVSAPHEQGHEQNHDEGKSFAAQNARDRDIASKWVGEDPWPTILLLSLAHEPLDVLMQEEFFVGSHEFEEQQREKMMRASLDGEGSGREYRLGIAAMGSLEKKFFEALGELFNGQQAWKLFPESCATLSFNGAAFILLSRLGCCVHQYVAWPHKQFPCKLFRLLAEPEAAGELSVVPDCLKDRWSQEFQKCFPSLSGSECMACLQAHGAFQRHDTANIESLHASIRRQVTMRSCQVWPVALRQVSAEFLLQCYRCKLQQRNNK
eukprot:5723167-Amphidinium_carterae.1